MGWWYRSCSCGLNVRNAMADFFYCLSEYQLKPFTTNQLLSASPALYCSTVAFFIKSTKLFGQMKKRQPFTRVFKEKGEKKVNPQVFPLLTN